LLSRQQQKNFLPFSRKQVFQGGVTGIAVEYRRRSETSRKVNDTKPQIKNAFKWRQFLLKLAFHSVKCGSEFFSKISGFKKADFFWS
jgi:hypothetical protein